MDGKTQNSGGAHTDLKGIVHSALELRRQSESLESQLVVALQRAEQLRTQMEQASKKKRRIFLSS